MVDEEMPSGDGSAGHPSGDGDPIAAELQALFALALADEPADSVTPSSVLRRAREEQAALHQRHVSRSRQWAGGLVAAAAVVVAVVLLGPLLANRGATGAAGSADGTSPVFAAAGAGSAAGGNQEAGSCASGSEACAYALPTVPNAVAAPGGSSAAPIRAAQDSASATDETGGDVAGSATSPAAGPVTVAGGTAVDGDVAPEGQGSDSAGSGRPAACMLPPLLPAARAATIDAVPAGTFGGIAPALCGANGAGGMTTGSVLRTSWQSGEVTVVVASHATASGSGAAGTAPSSAADGSVTVSAGRGGVVVTVTANPAAATHLTVAQLNSVATAVLDATR